MHLITYLFIFSNTHSNYNETMIQQDSKAQCALIAARK